MSYTFIHAAFRFAKTCFEQYVQRCWLKNYSLIRIGFAVVSTDDANNVAETSNVAVMNVFLAPPAVACSDKSGNSINSDPFEKTGDCFHFYQVSIIIFRCQLRIYQITQHLLLQKSCI